MTFRFVVLHHSGVGVPHYDLMLEADGQGPLRTWHCPAWPIDDDSACRPGSPHRRIYLEYEGELSGGRGRVRRVASGMARILSEDERGMTVELDGCRYFLKK